MLEDFVWMQNNREFPVAILTTTKKVCYSLVELNEQQTKNCSQTEWFGIERGKWKLTIKTKQNEKKKQNNDTKQQIRQTNLNSFSFNYQKLKCYCATVNCDAKCSNVSNKLRYLAHSIRTEERRWQLCVYTISKWNATNAQLMTDKLRSFFFFRCFILFHLADAHDENCYSFHKMWNAKTHFN